MNAVTRQEVIDRFLGENGWRGVVPVPLADDASARKYHRLDDGRGTALLMDFPIDAISVDPHGIYENPERPASVVPVITTTELFTQAGWRVPAIYASDVSQGLVLIEDFGDLTFTRALDQNGASKPALYLSAVDQLINLHRYCDAKMAQAPTEAETAERVEADLVVYGPDNFRRMLKSFKDDYLPLILPDPVRRHQAIIDFDMMLDGVLPSCWKTGEVIIHRDYHVDNLMLVENDEGGEDCGIIDFQDAAIAPRPYDLVSLLRDVRHDIGSELEASLKDRYCAAFENLHRSDFETSYMACNMVRNFRILGRFGWLAIKADKQRYFDFIPRCWDMILRDADCTLPELATWIANHVPADARLAPTVSPAIISAGNGAS